MCSTTAHEACPKLFGDSSLVRLWPFFAGYTAGATACNRVFRRRGGILAKAPLCGGVAKTHWSHSHRRTAVMASEKVTSCLPGYPTPCRFRQRAGNAAYHSAITAYSPHKHGAVRSTVCSVQPHVFSSFRYERSS